MAVNGLREIEPTLLPCINGRAIVNSLPVTPGQCVQMSKMMMA